MNTTIKRIGATTLLTALALSVLFIGTFVQAASPNWDVEGSYIVQMNYLGTDYAHDMTLTQNNLGELDGTGGSPTGFNVYTWDVTSGTVSGDTIDFYANYTATADAVTPQTVLHVIGTVASSGAMSGTWSDNYQGGDRSGTWVTSSGTAEMLIATLAAEDFGVVNYDTGLGMLKGYSAGFGLTDATFENVQSVVVQLFSGATLLQTNTATAKVGDEILGTQISSPFDVSGNFDYVTDGYWTNVREVQYGQSVPATRVVATVTLEDGQVVIAENTLLTGDPTTIYPPAPVSDTTPDTFTFIDQTGVALNTLIESNQITVTGINATTSVSVTGGEYSVNGAAYTAIAGIVVTGDTVKVRHTSAATTNTSVNTVLTIGGVTDTFTSTTLADVPPPVVTPTDKDQCKSNGWKTFTNPTFKNQGQCVSYTNHN